MDHFSLELLQSASIECITISAHALVSVTLTLPEGTHRALAWQLNETLLDDTAVVSKVTEVLAH